MNPLSLVSLNNFAPFGPVPNMPRALDRGGIMHASMTLVIGLMTALVAETAPTLGETLRMGKTSFPIGVWLQDPADAAAYKALGVTFYIGLWQGPTQAQIEALRAQDMRVICKLNDYARQHLLKDPTIVAWMHDDEPDLAHVYPREQLQGPKGKALIQAHWPELYQELSLDTKDYHGWGLGAHPIHDIQKAYAEHKAIDAERPVLIQLSKAVASNGKEAGRGDRDGQTWEYPLYLQGADVVSFDIYPVAYNQADRLDLVAVGVDQLKAWGAATKPILVAIEAGYGETAMASYNQQRAQIWMAINHGAQGIFWFTHRWQQVNGKNTLISAKMALSDAKIGDAVRRLNTELSTMAAVIAEKSMPNFVTADQAHIDLGVRQHRGSTYIFAVERSGKEGPATFTLVGLADARIEVLGEQRELALKGGRFTDSFTPNATHLYRITAIP